jgi:hypothetical protein
MNLLVDVDARAYPVKEFSDTLTDSGYSLPHIWVHTESLCPVSARLLAKVAHEPP